ncbi:FAD-dependent monooxygenase [Pseudonocardia nematodicida]|uniref:FAD-dependent monooxygenase n=1 Tax=Pseudonocardia nematodicida TaxID=1206997 RepID=A0ABV1K851_9PSEU
MRVTVVGAGIGGLAAAAGLHAAGHEVTVRERAPGPATDGTALGIWPAAVRALDDLGLGPGLRAVSHPQASGALCRPDGTRLARIDVRGEVHLVARPDLRTLLAGTLPGDTVRYGSPVAEADLPALRDGCDLLVGADGLHGTTRTLLPGGDRVRPRRTGTVAYRGVATVTVGAGTETWGRGARFGVLPHGPDGDRANWYAVLPSADAPPSPDPAADLALLRERFGAWHDPVPRVLARIGTDGYLRHHLADLRPPRRYTDGRRVAVLGDAVHAMTPDLGQGACQALLDGIALATAVTRSADLPSALRAYDRRRRPPTRRLVRLARAVHRVAQARRGTRLRDRAVSTLSALTPSSTARPAPSPH